MSIKTEVWGKSPEGKDVHKFTMTNAMGASVTVIEWGAICTSIIVPDAGGNMDDVALGFDSLEKYIAPHGCFGDTVGRYEVEYEDGEVLSIPLVYGLNITGRDRVWERHYQGDSEDRDLAERDSWSFDSKLAEVTYTTLPFRRGGETWFRIAVPDPHPEKRVVSVRTVKTCGDRGDILLGSFTQAGGERKTI